MAGRVRQIVRAGGARGAAFPAVCGDRQHDTLGECDGPAAVVAADARPPYAAHGGDEVTQLRGELIVRPCAVQRQRVQMLAECLALETGKRYTFRMKAALQQTATEKIMRAVRT